MTCSEYGFTYTKYFLKNEGIRTVHIQESNTILAQDIEDIKYELTEKLYDYREEPFRLYLRKDTFPTPDFTLLKSQFKDEPLDDFQATYEHLIMGYQKAWEIEIVY